MEIKRVLIPRASEGELLVRKLGHAVLLQWENLQPETRRLLTEQAKLVEFLGTPDPTGDEIAAVMPEPRSWGRPYAVK